MTGREREREREPTAQGRWVWRLMVGWKGETNFKSGLLHPPYKHMDIDSRSSSGLRLFLNLSDLLEKCDYIKMV